MGWRDFTLPKTDLVVITLAILATALELLVCTALIAIGVLGILNAICRRRLKKEGVTEENMEDLQRRMLEYAVKNRQEVDKLRWWGHVFFWDGTKAPSRQEAPKPMPIEAPKPVNIVDFNEWRERRLEAAE
jgi:hypothetical protein